MTGKLLVLGWLAVAHSVGGVSDLFDSRVKDFGNVPHGSVNVHQFVLTNTTGSVVRVSGLRSSCVCATAKAVNEEAQPGEKLIIEVAYNARKFTGSRSMTVYVTFSSPYYETVLLRVSGYSRQDVVFNPGQIDFGSLSRGDEASKTVKVEYAGGLNWRVTDVLPSQWVNAKIEELYREDRRVGYQLTVALKPEAPAGTLAQAIQLKTNDPKSPTLLVHASARIEANLVASPSELRFEPLPVGETASKRVLLRGSKPFSITAVGGDTEDVSVLATEGARKVHVVRIDFQPHHTGQTEKQILLHTDMANEKPLSYRILATVTAKK